MFFFKYHKKGNLLYCGSKGRKLLKSIKRAQHLAFRQPNSPSHLHAVLGVEGEGDRIPKWLEEATMDGTRLLSASSRAGGKGESQCSQAP